MKTRVTLASLEIPHLRLHRKTRVERRLMWLAAIVVFGALCASGASAQHRVSKRYPARKDVRIELKNISGTIVVESWNRDEIRLSAILESPKANLVPRQTGDGLYVDVMGDNRGRADVGNINFRLQVPYNSSVDLETRLGNITVTNIRGDLVRAHVSSEGDIELTGIIATKVIAENTTGDIFFDGEFARNGEYQFQSGKGNINIRIPANSDFNLTAAAPTRKIALGEFWNDRFRSLGDGRKYEGNVGDGRSRVTVTNFKGSITFIRR
ncbi:MAG: hypothetical protein M3539_09815 [Acidobacteriota bacterium]|nr:hypothetical protein [Acidobacteriota bacterium]